MRGLCCCTAAFRLCYLDNVTAAGTTPPTVQDTGNPIIRLLMCGNFTLLFLRLWLQLCPMANLPERDSWDCYLFIYLPGKMSTGFLTEINITRKLDCSGLSKPFDENAKFSYFTSFQSVLWLLFRFHTCNIHTHRKTNRSSPDSSWSQPGLCGGCMWERTPPPHLPGPPTVF